jgi:hypothetical protein
MGTWNVLSLNGAGSLSKIDGRREGGPEEVGCYRLEDTCTQKRRLEDGRDGGQGATRTVQP